jgi:conjugative transfer signal peptidase TraF
MKYRISVGYGLIVGLFIFLIVLSAGFRTNWSESMPKGLWREQALKGPVERGNIMLVCLPPTEFFKRYIAPGNCKNGMEPLIKAVVAVPGDTIEFTPIGAIVNNVYFYLTPPLQSDHTGQTLLPYSFGTYTVDVDEMILLSDYSPNSFDSRYFGPVKVDTIIARAIPIWTWR